MAYETPAGEVVSASEIRLPAGLRPKIVLTADEVIHSVCVPALGGKTGTIPGRINRVSLASAESGVYCDQCGEFCCLSHAQMALEAVVMEPAAFAARLATVIAAYAAGDVAVLGVGAWSTDVLLAAVALLWIIARERNRSSWTPATRPRRARRARAPTSPAP